MVGDRSGTNNYTFRSGANNYAFRSGAKVSDCSGANNSTSIHYFFTFINNYIAGAFDDIVFACGQ